MDYSLQQQGVQSYFISFLPGEMSDECQFVIILEDSALEQNEVFTISLQSTSPVADLNPSVANVIIIDNEGIIMFIFMSYVANIPKLKITFQPLFKNTSFGNFNEGASLIIPPKV